MSGSVAPLNVSPLIKAVRWTFLILGIFYGANKWQYLKSYEEKAGPKRKLELEAKHEKIRAEVKIKDTDELLRLGKEMEIDLPPGWDDIL